MNDILHETEDVQSLERALSAFKWVVNLPQPPEVCFLNPVAALFGGYGP